MGVPVWYNMLSQGLVAQPLFTFWMSQTAGAVPGGEITFGGINANRYTGPITYVPLTAETYWEFAMDDFQENGQSLGWCTSGCKAIADTGTSVITGPADNINALNRQLGAYILHGEGIFANCSILQTGPTINIVLNGHSFALELRTTFSKKFKVLRPPASVASWDWTFLALLVLFTFSVTPSSPSTWLFSTMEMSVLVLLPPFNKPSFF